MLKHLMLLAGFVFVTSLALAGNSNAAFGEPVKFPANNAGSINPDTRLTLTFSSTPKLGNSGKIRIYDAITKKLVDELDMSIPPGPRNNRTLAPYDSIRYGGYADSMFSVKFSDTNAVHAYQKNYIGGTDEADAFHFYPIIIKGNTAIICLHNNKLAYNKTYYVEIDAAVLTLKDGKFEGVKGSGAWTFSTKKSAPSLAKGRVVVAVDGSADFSTVQAAIDFMPPTNKNRITIFVKNGTYDEIVYFRNKENLSIIGEDREKTLIAYANNGVFNTRLMSPDPALANGSHSLRSVFTIHNSNGINLANLTLRSLGEKPAQAEALLVQGQKIIVSHVNIEGSGDALQATGNIYVTNSKIQGYGDNVLGYGAVFFNDCEFISFYGPHLWVRNTKENHGNVLFNCTLKTLGDLETTIARAPNSNGKTYPFVEAVLINCKMEGIRAEGWGQVADDPAGIRYWEYNSTNLTDSKPVDVTKRHPASKQLSREKDAAIIQQYSDPSFILKGWKPEVPLKLN